jgi:xylulokinase
VILTIDLGTSVTKAAVWNDSGLVAAGHAALTTAHHGGGKVEQDASTWWRSVEEACHDMGARSGVGLVDAIDAVVFAAARQTFVLVSGSGEPLGPALLWSDRRARAEAARLAAACGGADNVRGRTGAVLDGAAVAAKVAWLARHEPDRLNAADWIISPRDLMVWELTGVLATDLSLASATGLYDADGREVLELVGAAAGKLPEALTPDTVVGRVRPGPARVLGVKAGIPVVIGAGDRACEVLGTGASAERPMVAWGTTANVSVPVANRSPGVPGPLTVTRGALGGWLLEGGLSAAGSLLAWVGGLLQTSVEELGRQAKNSPPGARGVVALPWPGGARAPWWCDDAGAGFLGLQFEHRPGDLARSVLEAVAFDVARCLDAIRDTGVDPSGLAIGGSSATGPAWTEVISGVTGLPAQRRRSGEAAMAGAAMLASAALATGFELERLDPVATETAPPREVVQRYAELRLESDRIAAAVLGSGGSTIGGRRG